MEKTCLELYIGSFFNRDSGLTHPHPLYIMHGEETRFKVMVYHGEKLQYMKLFEEFGRRSINSSVSPLLPAQTNKPHQI